MPKNETQLQTNSLDLTKKSTGAAHHPSGNVAKFHTLFWEKQIGFIHFRKLLTFGIDAVCFIIVKVIFIFFLKFAKKEVFKSHQMLTLW